MGNEQQSSRKYLNSKHHINSAEFHNDITKEDMSKY